MRRILRKSLAIWFPFAVGLTCIFAFAYLATQQNYRQSVNDPQIQIAEDAAVSLARDYTPANIVPHGTALTDISTSLATWVTVYDASGTPLESSAVLHGAPPHLPAGLFDTTTWVPHKVWHAPSGPETRVTWQPESDVRQAVVLIQFTTSDERVGYVAAGRSMRTVEERIADLTYHAAVAWGITLIAVLIAIVPTLRLL